MPPHKLDTASSEPFRILDLPRELRDRIYRELLLPDKTDFTKNKAKSPYRLRPTILRASKQLHAEASRVLYKETGWVLLTTEQSKSVWLLENFRKNLFPWVSIRHLEHFPGTPVLRIGISDGKSGNPRHKSKMLVTQQDLQFFCIETPCLHHLEIKLCFDVQAMQNPRTREILLECCRDIRIRGPKKITIEQLYPLTARAELLDQMTEPIQYMHEISERADRYKERGDLQVSLGRLLDAADIYDAGWTFLQLSFNRGFNRVHGANTQRIAELKDKLISFSIECAHCHIRIGTPRWAHRTLETVLQNGKFTAFKHQHYRTIYYHKGLACVAERNEIQAAKSFRIVLRLEPGHKGADEQLDAMEGRLESMPLTKRCGIEKYLMNIAKRYRHRKPGRARLSNEETAVDGFCKVAS